jgi:hypothetical protein
MPTPLHASGTFDVKMLPQPASDAPEPGVTSGVTPGVTLGRALLDKQYHGELAASARGQMLSAVTPTAGSAGYVAIEQVHGTLLGRSGSFVLQHTGLMNRGARQLTITVVPDSGTDALAGLSGTMDIRITEGKHFYVFEGLLP